MAVTTEVPRTQSPAEIGGGHALLVERVKARVRLGLRHEAIRFGLTRDLDVPFEAPEARIPISVRKLESGDLPALQSLEESANVGQDAIDAAWRGRFASRQLNGGYVAVDDRDGTPCYVQWLLGPADNDFIASLGGFPRLKDGEALLENAYTPPKYRGMRIMPAAMARIAEHGRDVGARHVMTFVGTDNIPSLKGCKRSGFAPTLLHTETRYLFGTVRRDSFADLAADDPRRILEF